MRRIIRGVWSSIRETNWRSSSGTRSKCKKVFTLIRWPIPSSLSFQLNREGTYRKEIGFRLCRRFLPFNLGINKIRRRNLKSSQKNLLCVTSVAFYTLSYRRENPEPTFWESRSLLTPKFLVKENTKILCKGKDLISTTLPFWTLNHFTTEDSR